jgi:hypothetical protein
MFYSSFPAWSAEERGLGFFNSLVSILIHPQITRRIHRCCGTLFGKQWGRGCLFMDHILHGHLTFRGPCIVIIIKPTKWTNSQIYFWNRSLHISDKFSVHHQESSTVHTATGICHTVLDSWWWTENLSETHRFLFQKQIWQLVHLFGFIIRIFQGQFVFGLQWSRYSRYYET